MKRGSIQVRYKKEVFCSEGGEALTQDTQKSCVCPIPGNVQGEVEWGFEKPGLVKDVSAHGSGLEEDDF